jgi:tRNA pseudouridine55 synthase
LCADIGQTLGVGGHLAALERRRVGPLSIEQGITVDQVADQVAIGTLARHLVPLNQALDRLPAMAVTDEQARLVLHGGAVSPVGIERLPCSGDPVSIRLLDREGRLLAIGTYGGKTAGIVKVQKVLAESESLN